MNAELYLELLREAHLAAIQRGAPLTGGARLGLGERIDDDMQFNTETGSQDTPGTYSVPSESRELNVFADAALAEMKVGLTRQGLVDVLVNQFNIPRSNLVYAWDIPTYAVMRDGQRQTELEPEFFTGNPLDPASVADYMQSSAYRPNNQWAGRQGKDVSGATVAAFNTETGEGGPAPKYPNAEGPVYEHTNPFIANSATGWGIEAALGAVLGPTGLKAGKRLLGPLFRAMPQLPPAVLARFRNIARGDWDWKGPAPGDPDWNGGIGVQTVEAEQFPGQFGPTDDVPVHNQRGAFDQDSPFDQIIADATGEAQVVEWSDELNEFFDKFRAGVGDLHSVEEIELVEEITRFLESLSPEDQRIVRGEIFQSRIGQGVDNPYRFDNTGLWNEMDRIRGELPQGPVDPTRGNFRPRGFEDGTKSADRTVQNDGAGMSGGPPDAPPPAGGFADDTPPFGSADNPFPEHWSQTRRDMWGQDPNWDAPPPTDPRINTELVQTPYGQWVTPDEFNRRGKAYKEINLDHTGAIDPSTGEFMSPTESSRRRSTLSPEEWDFYIEHPRGDYETGRTGPDPSARLNVWEEMLGETDPSPLSFTDALKSLGSGAAIAGATAVTAQTLFPEQVEKVVSGLATFNDGWWSWIKEFPEHLDWVVRATGATLDGMEQGTRSMGSPVLDGLGDGFREQAHSLATQLGEGTVPLVGREDPELLTGVGRDLSQNGHNGNQIFPNDTRKEIENGDAMIVGYRSDEDYQRALGAAGRYGVVIDGNYWRRPSDSSLKPREGEEWTREHLQKMAASGYFGGAV